MSSDTTAELVFGRSKELAFIRSWVNGCIGVIDRFKAGDEPSRQQGYRQAMEDIIEILDLWESERGERS